MKDKILATYYICGKTLTIAQDSNGRYYRTIKGRGWNTGSFHSNSNPYVLLSNGLIELRQRHPRAEIYEIELSAEMENFKQIAEKALSNYAKAGMLKIRFWENDGIVEYFTDYATFCEELRDLGFSGSW